MVKKEIFVWWEVKTESTVSYGNNQYTSKSNKFSHSYLNFNGNG